MWKVEYIFHRLLKKNIYISINPISRPGPFGTKENCRNIEGYDSYIKNSYGAIWNKEIRN
jgi:hypothetical protein